MGSQASDVDEEMWIRAAARRLQRSAGPSGPAERGDVEAVLPGRPPWMEELAWLEALSRAGRTADPALAAERPDERIELFAARLRVLASDGPAFEERLARGLRSPFAAMRAAALERAALWTLEPSALDGAAARFLARELSLGGLEPDLTDHLFELALRSAGGRRLGVLLALPIAGETLIRLDRGGWDPALGFMEDLLGVPLTKAELASLRDLGADPGALACLELVARVRDGLEVPAPSVEVIVSSMGDGSRDLDATVEAFLDALVIDARHLGDETVRALGEALVRSVREATESEGAGGTERRDRLIRAAARILPLARQLELGLGYREDEALELWFALDRAERWRGGPEVVEALALWLEHPASAVRDAVVRAVGPRYAYGDRGDFEPLLVLALEDPDPTLRSLSFAWLVKSDRRLAPQDALGPVLRAAWDAEGHGGEGPALTERQARWLAQFPRDRNPRHYRDALLGLLSLSGASTEVIGAGSLELLGALVGDQEVFARVSLLAERSLVGLEAARDLGARLPFDSAAARAIRILQRVDPGAAEEIIDGALRRSMHLMHGPETPEDARPQLPKSAAGLLGLTPGGRQRLVSYLGDSVPRRVRFEAALQLLKRGHGAGGTGASRAYEASAERLMADYDGVDGALRLRALDALGEEVLGALPSVETFLAALSGAGIDQSERTAAIDVLGRRGHLRALEAVLDAAVEVVGSDAATIDAAAFAARALRHSVGRSAAGTAFQLGARTLRKIEDRARRATQLETVRGALLEALAELLVAGLDPTLVPDDERRALLARFLREPIRSEETAASAGFGRQRRIEASFLWASELAALRTLGRRSELLEEAIGPEPRWGRLDGRLLLALAHVAAEAGSAALAQDLSGAAAIALEGEGVAQDHERRLAEARWLHAWLALEGSREAEAARSLRALLGSYRTGDLGRGVLRAMLPSIRRPVASAHARYRRAMAGPSGNPLETARSSAWRRLE
ncbi:hypothetical protein Poly30_42860 [Planctomycetes bacterium Poly30]|uniref:HEAT repeat protein n=2 Tax=Saltatorellus ferox TaxID=2528018 RepID=A0A518EXD3_9BACT|nr:hypothetical protein Poly30_42860 [Planctomycetes bacterium Poly30]